MKKIFNNHGSTTSIIIAIIIVAIFHFIFLPTFNFWLGFAMGGFVKLFIGNWILKGFELIGFSNFNIDAIPYICGIISCFSTFLPHTISTKGKKND